jgi:hypothetical protein
MPDVDLLLPLKRELADYASRMRELVGTLAAVEQRPITEILNDLSGPSGDVLRFRVAGSVSALGNVPLDHAIKLIEGARELLWSSAFSVIRPEALHPQRTTKQVREFMESCRLGQTERGSFVAAILAPVPPELQPCLNLDGGDFQPGNEPFARRVTTRLMSSLGLVGDALQAGEAQRLLEAIPQGVSANLCNALVTMKPPGDESRLDIQVAWARTRLRLPAGVPGSVSFPQEYFPLIEEVGRQLTTRLTARRERFEGGIVSLRRAKRPLFPEVAGWMVMATELNGTLVRVRFDLNAEEFSLACDALRDDRRVAVTGIIRHDVKAGEYVVSEPSGFETETGTRLVLTAIGCLGSWAN